jgi:hypothetical protein
MKRHSSCCSYALTDARHSHDHLEGNSGGIYAYLANNTVDAAIFAQFIPVVYVDDQLCRGKKPRQNTTI